jgi:ribosomal protein S18 acetylase RimI-like enzyme
MRPYIEPVWGWEDEVQLQLLDERFDAARWQIVVVNGEDIGLLDVSESPDEVLLVDVELMADWQGRGIGSEIIRTLLTAAHESGRALTLQVLHSNPRAAALYERSGLALVETTATHFHLRADPPLGV